MKKVAAPGAIFIFLLILPIILKDLTPMVDSAVAGPESANSAKAEAAAMLDRILAAPEKYLEAEIVVAGVLQAAGHGSHSRFFLAGPEGKTLEVQPWAPLELYHPPSSRIGPARPKAMRYFVDRRLLLKGRLQREGERYILQVSSAEEL